MAKVLRLVFYVIPDAGTNLRMQTVIQVYYGRIVIGNSNGMPMIRSVTVFPEYRGKGMGKILVNTYSPDKCWLCAWPTDDGKLTPEQLRTFYRKLGFKFYWCAKRQVHYGFKGFRPTKKFWKRLLRQ